MYTLSVYNIILLYVMNDECPHVEVAVMPA